MKRLLIAICFLAVSSAAFCQTCEQREHKLLVALGSFSVGMLYNTYLAIGSVADGYAYGAYKAATADSLLNDEKTITDNLVKVLVELKSGNYIKDKSDIDYINTAMGTLRGLKMEAQLIQDYVKNKTQQNLKVYDAQRAKNWKDISTLMGLK